MRLITTFLIFGLTISLYCQNFKKILSAAEIDSLNNGLILIKTIDKTNCKDFDDFQGKMMISKSSSNFDWHFVGLSSKYDINGLLKAQFKFDSIGNMITYQEFTDNGEIVYDCTYDYKIFNNCLYRLEHIMLYYSPNILREDGWRYLKTKDEKGNKCEFSSQRKFGHWTYYLDNGTIERTKDYGDIK